MKLKKVTVAALVKAAEKNGFEWEKASQGRKNPSRILSCVVGQGVMNLGGTNFPTNFIYEENNTMLPVLVVALRAVYKYNDHEAKTYEDAVKFMKKALAPYMRRMVPIGWM